MGYVKHHAIVVTSWSKDMIQRAHAKAVELRCSVTPVVDGAVNGQRSFMIAPDGSKEDWDHSEVGDAQRESFVRWADGMRYDDGATSLAWVEVAFGSDDRDASVTRHAWGRPSLLDEITR